jgi:hypothetical protein
MSANNMLGAVLIRENTLLPADFAVETEAVFPGWRAVRNLDGYELGRKIQKANWNFFYLAGVITIIAFGREKQKTVHRAVREILANLNGKQFNSVEITGIVAKRFLGIPFVSVAAHSRHIQESLYLVPVEGRASGMNAAALQGQTPQHGQVLTSVGM